MAFKASLWKVFDEMERLGRIETEFRPKLIGVQPVRCETIVRVYETDCGQCVFDD